MTAFDKAWDFLKADESYTGQPKFGGNQKQPLDMHEYPPGSGNFMTLQDIQRKINAPPRSRANVGGQPAPKPNMQNITVDGKEMDRKEFYNQNRNNIMVSPTGNLSDIPEEQRWNPL